MGTNYYVNIDTCKYCGRSEKEIHIGKSSGGWQFTFQYNGGEYYKNIKELKEWLRGKKIKDEYGGLITHKRFWQMVKEKQGQLKHGDVDNQSLNIGGFDFLNCEFS